MLTRKYLLNISKSNIVILDLGCGTRRMPNTIGVDKVDTDIVCDIEKGLPIEDGVVDKIFATYALEHFDTVFIMEEMYRVLREGGEVEALVPYYNSIGAFKDPTHKSFYTEETFRYFTGDTWYGSKYTDVKFKVESIKFYYSNLIKFLPLKKYLRRYLCNMVGSMEVRLRKVRSDP